jgi:hypothetical protein
VGRSFCGKWLWKLEGSAYGISKQVKIEVWCQPYDVACRWTTQK